MRTSYDGYSKALGKGAHFLNVPYFIYEETFPRMYMPEQNLTDHKPLLG